MFEPVRLPRREGNCTRLTQVQVDFARLVLKSYYAFDGKTIEHLLYKIADEDDAWDDYLKCIR